MHRPTETSSDPVRVLVVGIRWPSRPFIDDLLIALAGEGLSITVATPPGSSPPPGPISSVRVPGSDSSVLADPVGLASGLLTLARHPVSGSRLMRTLPGQASGARSRLIRLGRCAPALRGTFDVIYMPWVGTLVSHAALVGGGIPIVVSCRGSQVLVARHNPARESYFGGMSTAIRNVDAVHCVSADLGREIESLGVPRDRIEVIHSGVDQTVFRPGDQRLRADRLRLVTVGRLHWKKGQEYALLALRRLIDEGVPARLTVVGDGPDLQRLLYTSRDLGLENRVEFPGELDREELLGVLHGSDVFVLPSLSEGISNAALEAMACGLPVVSTTVGGMPEAIRDGIDGMLVPPRDPSALARSLGTLWNDAGLRTMLGKAARERVVTAFDREAQVTSFAQLLRTVAGKPAADRESSR